MTSNRTVTVFGPYGHTGRFVVAELRKRGWTPVLSGRDGAKLKAAGETHPGSEVHLATVDDPVSIEAAIRTPDIRVFMTLTPIADLRDPNTPMPTAADESGRSSQIFLVDVIVREGSKERRTVARGRDIYAITAPIVVEAAQRVVNGLAKATGVVAAGEAFDARDFLASLSPAHLALESL